MIVSELQRMETEGLVERKHDAWMSTFKGQVARERFVQSLGGRAACLREQHLYALDDLMLAIIVAPQLNGETQRAENDDTIRVYLHLRADDCRSTGESLVEKGCVRLIDHYGVRDLRAYYPTGRGMRYYEDVVRAIPSLGTESRLPPD